jgi:hypothetical protein
MKPLLTVISVLMAACSFGQGSPAVSVKEFRAAEGNLKGWLTYLDYSSGKPFSMPAEVNVRVSAQGLVILALNYPKEPKANGNDTIAIGNNGTMLNGAIVVDRAVMEDGSIKLITEINGVDGNQNRKAVIRHIYIIGKAIFQNRKEVKFDGEDKWTMRNEYLFIR